VYKVLEWDRKTGGALRKDKKDYCLENNGSKRSCLGGNIRVPPMGYRCNQGRSCIEGFRAPESFGMGITTIARWRFGQVLAI
jgi:hypothetical protein